MNTQSRAHRKPPDVEEALSSMLWTPYDNNLSESDSSDESEVLHRYNNNYSFFGTGANHDHRPHQRQQQQQSLMRRSLSAWSYRARTGKPSPSESTGGNRFSYPCYDHDELGVGALSGLPGGWSGGSSNNNHVNDSFYGYNHGVPMANSSSSYSLHGTSVEARRWEDRAPWQTVQTSTGDGFEKRPYLQLQTPFVGRWHRVPADGAGAGASQLETSSLPFSLLALDNSAAMLPSSRSVPPCIGAPGTGDGFADSYRDDYQVYPAGCGEKMASDWPRNGNNIGSTNVFNNNHGASHDGKCNRSINNGSINGGIEGGGHGSLCIISAMLKPNMRTDGDGGNGGDLHFSTQHHQSATAQHPRWQQHRKSASTSPSPGSRSALSTNTTPLTGGRPWQHNSSITLPSSAVANHESTSVLHTLVAVGGSGGRGGGVGRGLSTKGLLNEGCTHTDEGALLERKASSHGEQLAVDVFPLGAVAGSTGVDPIARTRAQQCSIVSGGGSGEEGERELVEPEGPALPCAGSGFSSVRQANGEASASVSASRSSGAQKDRVRASVTIGVVVASGGGASSAPCSSSSPEGLASVMRLNVPAAGMAEGSRTSVYIPSTFVSSSSSCSSSSSPSSSAEGGLQALTIQVNRLDPNNQQQNDVVNNPSSGVSIVSCYRAAIPSASVSGAGVAAGAVGDCGGDGGGLKSSGIQNPVVIDRQGSVRADNGDNGGLSAPTACGDDRGAGDRAVDRSAVNTSVVNASEQMVQVSSGSTPTAAHRSQDRAGPGGQQPSVDEQEGSVGPPQLAASVSASPSRTYTSTEAQTDDTIQAPAQPLQQAPSLPIHAPVGAAAAAAGGTAATVGPYVGSPGPEPTAMLGVAGMTLGGGLLMTASPPPLGGVLPPGSEFSTREHRRRERRERRQARNRLQHIHPLEPPPPSGGPGLLHRSPPPLEIIPDILHSHLPPPYTTLPMGASLIPQMIPGHAASAAAVAAASAIPVRAADDCRYTFPIPIMRSSPSERSRKGCCGHWFAGPPLRALIAVVALGGVACALGGAALGATGLAGSPTSHLTAALLMIGVGVILVTVSGAAWRMTAPGAPPCLGLGSTVDLGRCSRRPCGRGGSTPHGLLYPEFQHRPPPPSYQASMQEYRLRLLLLDRDRQSGRMRSTASPPPTYRSNVGSLLRIPLSSRYNNGSSNSIFGGISGIISGAVGGVGGGSSSSVNNVPPSADPQVNSSPNGPMETSPNPYGDGHSTLPPSYRSVHLGVDTLQRQTPPAPLGPPQSSSRGSPVQEQPGRTRDVNMQPADAAELATSAVATAGTAHHTPSIIKIDDRRHSMVPLTEVAAPGRTEVSTRRRCSIPALSAMEIGVEAPSRNDGNASITSRPCTVEAVESRTTTSTYTSTMAGGTGKDLVTIVTISGTVEPSSTGASKAVYTTSNGNGIASGSNGATCTLLNSNATPLLATVIPVSKSSTTGPL